MKSQIKDIIIGIFAVIGFAAIVMGFNNPAEPQQVTYATPESHVWELVMSRAEGGAMYGRPYLFNKVTGEVRKYNNDPLIVEKDGKIYNEHSRIKYAKMNEAKANN